MGAINVNCNSTLAKQQTLLPTPSRLSLRMSRALACLISLFFAGAGCVSVNLAGDKLQKSNDVKFVPPGGAFKAISTEADAAWKNQETGATIAFQSACGDSADLPLDSLSQELMGAYEEREELSRKTVTFDSREAMDLDVKGKLDGVLTRARTIIYKKNRCSYTITFVSVPQSTHQDTPIFEKFLTSFRAP